MLMIVASGLVVMNAVRAAPPEAPAKPGEKPAEHKAAEPSKPAEKPAASDSVLEGKVTSIDGKEVDLAQYRGKVVLIVNVASKCGYTPQYAGLEKLYREKKDAGLVVLGFPANDFGRQEPGSNEQIAEFCKGKYEVTFPMFAKIAVTGSDQHPLYKRLSSQPAPVGGEPKWNFTKFLVGRDGKVAARFDSAVKPDDAKLVGKVEELLKAGAQPAEPGAKPAGK
jgi:glutathione peroxidase